MVPEMAKSGDKITQTVEVIESKKLDLDESFFEEKAKNLEAMESLNINSGCTKNGQTVAPKIDQTVFGYEEKVQDLILEYSQKADGKNISEIENLKNEANTKMQTLMSEFSINLDRPVKENKLTQFDADTLKNNYPSTLNYRDGVFSVTYGNFNQ